MCKNEKQKQDSCELKAVTKEEAVITRQHVKHSLYVNNETFYTAKLAFGVN